MAEETVNTIEVDEEQPTIQFHPISQPELSDWKCYLFGSDDTNGIVWQPTKDNVPNWFWRLMQRLILGNRWVKTNK